MSMTVDKKIIRLLSVFTVTVIIGYLVGKSFLAIIGIVLVFLGVSGIPVLRAKYKEWLFYGMPVVGFTLGLLISNFIGK